MEEDWEGEWGGGLVMVVGRYGGGFNGVEGWTAGVVTKEGAGVLGM